MSSSRSTEAKRAVKELGFKGIFVRPNPVKGRNIDDPYYDPLYKTVVDLGVPLLVHEGSGAFLPTAGADRFAGQWFFTHTISHPLEQMLASLGLICRGALERNPELQCVFLEAGAGWLPYWLWRMDEHYEVLPFQVPWLKMKPSDYFRRQCFMSFEADETRFGEVISSIGADHVVFASDYPHWDATFPGVTDMILNRNDLDADTKRKIMGENAAQIVAIGLKTVCEFGVSRIRCFLTPDSRPETLNLKEVFMADTPKLVSSMGRAELDRIFVRDYDLNQDLLGKISFAQMVCLMLEGRMPTPEEGRMIDTMLIVLVDHGMTTGAAAARMTFHSAPEAIQGAVAAAILGAGSVHLGSSEHCAKMFHDALPRNRRKPISTPSR